MQANLIEFAEWLKYFTETEIFIALSQRYIDIHKQLKVEHERAIRRSFIDEADELINNI